MQSDEEFSMRYMILWALLGSFLMFSCESTLDIEVGVLWQDDSRFVNSHDRYLALLEGKFDSQTGFDSEVKDQVLVLPANQETHRFSFDAGGSNNYTAFIYIDENANGSYDEGYDVVSGYKYNCVDKDARLRISVSSFY